MVSITDLSKQFGGQTLFVNANVQFDAGSRYGIVGANGSGKSTLLRVIAGQETASSGTVTIPKWAVVGVLAQDHFQLEDTPIIHVVMMGHTEVWAAFERKEKMLALPPEEFDEFKYGDVEDTILRLGGYSLESKAAEILEGMQIPTASHYEPLSTLSGGYKLRVLLARTLASEPDLLLLDEPNNHLDILSLRWLEKFLMSFSGCAIVVSHDHRFLDNMCTHIVDVDYERVTLYRGNYERFLERKLVERVRQEKEINKREKEIARHAAFVTRFKAKANKARQANSRQKRMEKIQIEPLPLSSRKHPGFGFPQRRPSGRKVLDALGISKTYGSNVVLSDVDLEVHRGDCIAIIGPNGIGKSTLLKVLMDRVTADSGMVEWGYETHVGYFAQDHTEVLDDGNKTVLSWLWEQAPNADAGAVYGRLGALLFNRDDTAKRLQNLSGGEAARLVLGGLAARRPNVLVLDEPTNHLDLEGIESLAKALKSYEGTILLVSHNRWFVGQVATRIFEIRHDGVEDYTGTYAEYLRDSDDDHLDRNQVWEKARAAKRREKKGRR